MNHNNFKLVSLLRGYNYLKPSFTPVLLGYGKGSRQKTYDETRQEFLEYYAPYPEEDDRTVGERMDQQAEDDKKREAFGKLMEGNPLNKWIAAFSSEDFYRDVVSNNHSASIGSLVDFVRAVILALTPEYKDFHPNIEKFLGKLRDYALKLVRQIDKRMLSRKPQSLETREYDYFRENRIDECIEYMKHWRLIPKVYLTDAFLKFILHYIVIATPDASDVEMSIDRFSRRLNDLAEGDEEEYLGIDLQKSAAKDYYDYISEPKRKKPKKEGYDDDDDEYVDDDDDDFE